MINAHLEEHGDIRAADVIDLLVVGQSHASYILKREVDAGRIEIPEGAPSRGRGVHYVSAGEGSTDRNRGARP